MRILCSPIAAPCRLIVARAAADRAVCGGSELSPALKYARCWGITMIVFGAFNILGLGNLITIGMADANFTIATLAGALSGVLCVTSGSLVSCCCIPNVGQDHLQVAAASLQKTKIAFYTSIACPILFLVSMILALINLMGIINCISVDCSSAVTSVDYLPSGCIASACEENSNYGDGTANWGPNDDCIAGTQNARCSTTTTNM